MRAQLSKILYIFKNKDIRRIHKISSTSTIPADSQTLLECHFFDFKDVFISSKLIEKPLEKSPWDFLL